MSTQFSASWCLFHAFCKYCAWRGTFTSITLGSLWLLFNGLTGNKSTVCLLLELWPPGTNPELLVECRSLFGQCRRVNFALPRWSSFSPASLTHVSKELFQMLMFLEHINQLSYVVLSPYILQFHCWVRKRTSQFRSFGKWVLNAVLPWFWHHFRKTFRIRHLALGLDLKTNPPMSMLTTNRHQNWWGSARNDKKYEDGRFEDNCLPFLGQPWFSTQKNISGLRRVYQARTASVSSRNCTVTKRLRSWTFSLAVRTTVTFLDLHKYPIYLSSFLVRRHVEGCQCKMSSEKNKWCVVNAAQQKSRTTSVARERKIFSQHLHQCSWIDDKFSLFWRFWCRHQHCIDFNRRRLSFRILKNLKIFSPNPMLLYGRIVLGAESPHVVCPRILARNDYAREVHTLGWSLALDPFFFEFQFGVISFRLFTWASRRSQFCSNNCSWRSCWSNRSCSSPARAWTNSLRWSSIIPLNSWILLLSESAWESCLWISALRTSIICSLSFKENPDSFVFHFATWSLFLARTKFVYGSLRPWAYDKRLSRRLTFFIRVRSLSSVRW